MCDQFHLFELELYDSVNTVEVMSSRPFNQPTPFPWAGVVIEAVHTTCAHTV